MYIRYPPGAMVLEVAPVKESEFGKQDGWNERHFQQLIQTDIHLKSVLFLFRHKWRHAGAPSVCHADQQFKTWYPKEPVVCRRITLYGKSQTHADKEDFRLQSCFIMDWNRIKSTVRYYSPKLEQTVALTCNHRKTDFRIYFVILEQ